MEKARTAFAVLAAVSFFEMSRIFENGLLFPLIFDKFYLVSKALWRQTTQPVEKTSGRRYFHPTYSGEVLQDQL